jgi:hypothetical protein
MGIVWARSGFLLGLKKPSGAKSGPSPARPDCWACNSNPNPARMSKKPSPAQEARPDPAKIRKIESSSPARLNVRIKYQARAHPIVQARPGLGFSGRVVRAGLPMPCCTLDHGVVEVMCPILLSIWARGTEQGILSSSELSDFLPSAITGIRGFVYTSDHPRPHRASQQNHCELTLLTSILLHQVAVYSTVWPVGRSSPPQRRSPDLSLMTILWGLPLPSY